MILILLTHFEVDLPNLVFPGYSSLQWSRLVIRVSLFVRSTTLSTLTRGDQTNFIFGG